MKKWCGWSYGWEILRWVLGNVETLKSLRLGAELIEVKSLKSCAQNEEMLKFKLGNGNVETWKD